MTKQPDASASDFAKLSQPAQRALADAGYTRLEQLAKVTESELLKLHGFGPKSIRLLRADLEARDLSFAK